ncbi:MAG TPA: NAD-dependent epimerase/dehydratase family protein [Chitinophagaceae bacterium]|nr:NAD-dependent epimerase/dehydratase family protein [Chitinophagaceae bacterium]
MKIFITGSTGYIGNLLALRLAKEGNQVHALVRDPEKAASLKHPNIKLFKGDVNDSASIKDAMDGCEAVFHLAAFARMWAKPSDIFYKVNVEGTRNVLQAAVENNISKLVYTSSTAVFGTSINQPLCEDDPRTIGFKNDYDLSKCIAEKLVKEYAANGLNALIVNPSRVYGPGNATFSNPFTRLLKAAIKGNPIPIPQCPDVVANYSYVHDVVEGHILAMKFGKQGERYILGGENVSYRRFVEVVGEVIPVKSVLPIPKFLLKVAGLLQLARFAITKKPPTFTPATVDRYYTNTAFSCRKAMEQLHYHVTPFKQAMTNTIHHLKQNNNETV